MNIHLIVNLVYKSTPTELCIFRLVSSIVLEFYGRWEKMVDCVVILWNIRSIFYVDQMAFHPKWQQQQYLERIKWK